MTTSDFRENPILVGSLKALLISADGQPSVLAQAIVAVQNERPSPRVAEHSTEIVSIRRLDRIAGFDESLELLLSCAEPMPVQAEEPPALFGVDPSQFQQPA